VEPDIDYYKDLLAHALLEVAANQLTHTLTDPRQVYVLRWIAGRRANIPNFFRRTVGDKIVLVHPVYSGEAA
jgi:hypothetical protein